MIVYAHHSFLFCCSQHFPAGCKCLKNAHLRLFYGFSLFLFCKLVFCNWALFTSYSLTYSV